MNYAVSFLVAVAIQWIYALRHPLHDDPLPPWLGSVLGGLILTLPLSLLCRFVTRKIKGIKARTADLAILLGVVGAYWAASFAMGHIPHAIHSPALPWLRLTWDSWSIIYLPFGATMALFEWIETRNRPDSNQAASSAPIRDKR